MTSLKPKQMSQPSKQESHDTVVTFLENGKDNYMTSLKPKQTGKPSEQEAYNAIVTLLQWIGENPTREGLKDTPKRIMKAYREMFSGYHLCPVETLSQTFEDFTGYSHMIIVKNIEFYSHCEHHMAPIIGKAHIGYIPNKKIVGLSKIARIVDIFAQRLQIQESMTEEIAETIQKTLNPYGTAVIIEAEHMCMTMRGIHKKNTTTITSSFKEKCNTDENHQKHFINMTIGRANND